MNITKHNGTNVEAGDIGEKPGIVVMTAVARKYTLLMRINCTMIDFGRKDQL